MSTLSHLRLQVIKTERRIRQARWSGDPKSAFQRNAKKLAGLRGMLAREEARMMNPDALL